MTIDTPSYSQQWQDKFNFMKLPRLLLQFYTWKYTVPQENLVEGKVDKFSLCQINKLNVDEKL